jgi:hypothetical protein
MHRIRTHAKCETEFFSSLLELLPCAGLSHSRRTAGLTAGVEIRLSLANPVALESARVMLTRVTDEQ